MSEKDRIFDAWWMDEQEDGTVSAEDLYQAFKARLMEELVATHRSPHTALSIEYDLAERSES